jgi:organic radical activating enzyme
MKIGDFKNAPTPALLLYEQAKVPHATVETNRTCDLGCRLCYNLDRASIKTLADIKAEVDTLAEKRALQTVSLLGGEPTLHPGLAEIIAHIKRRGALCQLLTNGRRLLADEDGSYLDSLIRAGLDRIQVHIDEGQTSAYSDIDAARRKVFAKLEARRVHFGLSVTVYKETRSQLAALARAFSRYKYFDGILAILGQEPMPPSTQYAQLEDEFEGLSRGLGITPSAYIPSNKSRDDVHWLLYLYFLNPADGTAFAISPVFDKILRRAYRLLKGREVFIIIVPPALAGPALALAAAAECLIHPANALRIIGLILKALGKGTRLQYIVIQDPPRFDGQTGRMLICQSCPDATIRNGRLTPVCLADRMNPLPGYGLPTDESRAWSPAVQAYLEGR